MQKARLLALSALRSDRLVHSILDYEVDVVIVTQQALQPLCATSVFALLPTLL